RPRPADGRRLRSRAGLGTARGAAPGPSSGPDVVAHALDIRQPDPLSRDDPRTRCAKPARVEPLHAPTASLPGASGRRRTRHGLRCSRRGCDADTLLGHRLLVEGAYLVAGSGPLVGGVPLVRAEGLGKRYAGSVWALREISFDVAKGSVLGIVGENGSGKSTLLDLLMGVTRPTEGSLSIDGPTASIVELGAGFFNELTGYQNAVQAGLVSGLTRPEADSRAREVG